ncbi:MAG: hypothetical protein R3B45_15890 [Bdellovibrionota bacterium]
MRLFGYNFVVLLALVGSLSIISCSESKVKKASSRQKYDASSSGEKSGDAVADSSDCSNKNEAGECLDEPSIVKEVADIDCTDQQLTADEQEMCQEEKDKGVFCDVANGYVNENGECKKVSCDSTLDKTSCKVALGGGEGMYERSCVNDAWQDDTSSCVLSKCSDTNYVLNTLVNTCDKIEICDTDAGFEMIDGKCVKVICDTSVPRTSCSVSTGGGIGEVPRSCVQGEWVNDQKACLLTKCNDDKYSLSVATNSCDLKPLVLTVSTFENGPSKSTFAPYEPVYFKLENAFEAAELCITMENDLPACASDGPGWEYSLDNSSGYYKVGTTYKSSPWFSAYSTPASQRYIIFARLVNRKETTVYVNAAIAKAIMPVASASLTASGSSVVTVDSRRAFYVRGDNLGYESIKAGMDTGEKNAAVCFAVEGDAKCDNLLNFTDLSIDASWSYDLSYAGGKGRWTGKFEANTVPPGIYKVYFYNKRHNVKSTLLKVTVK